MQKQTTFSDKLRQLRQAKGLSQNQLAGRAKMSQQGINLLEAGKRQPSMETVRRLALALEVGPEQFF